MLNPAQLNTLYEDLFDMTMKATEQWGHIMDRVMVRKTSEDDPANSVMEDFSQAFLELAEELVQQPQLLLGSQMELMQKQMQLWQTTALKFAGGDSQDVVEVANSDRRFKDEEWQTNPLFSYIKQFYLIQSEAIIDIVEKIDGVSESSKEKVHFLLRQYLNALSPSNFATTNPEVIRKTLETGGGNLVKGLQQLAEDLEASYGGLNVTMSDTKAFSVGNNLATTKGQVVYQNDLIQLIQYQPTTKNTFKRPLLVVPPFINKYYILDLREKNSFLKWLVDQGHTVFCISWNNPGPEFRDKGFENYMLEGPLAALNVIEELTGEQQVNAIGYCLGGTLLASTLAYMKKKKDNRIVSATYMATLLDFSDPGEIGIFINETAISALEKQMDALGYYDGRMMAFSFNMLKENDLFWSFFINNYLKGERPMAFDLLYWNTDGTNLPAKMHSFYLRNMYLYNKLKQPNGIELAGEAIDLTAVDTPSYFLSTSQDHIAKWQSTYKGAQLFKGDVQFVLGGSGHIAGVVNPPSANKYGYWLNDDLSQPCEQWLQGALKQEGSWWPHWQEWICQYAGDSVAARNPKAGIEPAPGSYVRKRIVDVIMPTSPLQLVS